MTRLTAVVREAQGQGLNDDLRREGAGQRSVEECRPTRTATGRPRNSAARPAKTASDREPQPRRNHGTRPAGLARTGTPPLGRSIGRFDQDGGRNPNDASIAWPLGPANQARNAWAALAFADALITTPE